MGMRKPRLFAAILAGALAGVCVSAEQAGTRSSAAKTPAGPATDCDRRCLLRMLTAYTEALTANDASRLPAASNVRVTSNGTVTALGHGELWGTPRRISYRQTFVDPVSTAAVFFGVVTNTVNAVGRTEGPHWWFYVVRLKIGGQKLTEVEEISYEKPTGGFGGDATALPPPDRIFETILPESERVSRDQLFDIANEYFDVVSHRVDYRSGPWHPACQRVELGLTTAGTQELPGSCGGGFRTLSPDWNVSNRRFYVADEARGVVVAAGYFKPPLGWRDNSGTVIFEAFKVESGLIRQILAFFRGTGQLHSGWGDGPGS